MKQGDAGEVGGRGRPFSLRPLTAREPRLGLRKAGLGPIRCQSGS
jgi:hypothetical protein